MLFLQVTSASRGVKDAKKKKNKYLNFQSEEWQKKRFHFELMYQWQGNSDC